jgi:hypothetical protein
MAAMRADRRHRITCAGLLLAIACAAVAAPAWTELAADTRLLLAPFEAHWQQLPAAHRQQLLDNAALWQQLDPPAQARLLARLREWQELPAPLRNRVRDRHAIYRALDPATRDAVQQQYHRWQAADDEQRERLLIAFQALPPDKRRALLLADDQRDLATLARQVFAYVPDGERHATLQMLESLDAGARTHLLQLARRLAPWQRETLRQELLALPADRRATHLAERPRRR